MLADDDDDDDDCHPFAVCQLLAALLERHVALMSVRVVSGMGAVLCMWLVTFKLLIGAVASELHDFK